MPNMNIVCDEVNSGHHFYLQVIKEMDSPKRKYFFTSE